MNLAWIRNLTLLAAVSSLIGLASVDSAKDLRSAAQVLEAGDADLTLRLAGRALLFGSLTPEQTATAHRLRAAAAWRLDHRAFAHAELALALQAQPQELESLILRGDLLLEERNYGAALADLDQAVALAERNYPEATGIQAMRVAKRGLAHFGLKRYQEAAADTKRAMQLKRGLPLAHHLRSLLLEAAGKLPEALEAMEVAYALKRQEGGLFRLVEMEPEGSDWLGRLIDLRMRNNVDPQRPFLDQKQEAAEPDGP